MDYLWNHTALYDGHFNLLHFVIILISVAVISYCTFKLKDLNKKKQELEAKANDLAPKDIIHNDSK